ncbi:MAG: hypothetical protein ACJASY_003586 [Halioglobus sp.]
MCGVVSSNNSDSGFGIVTLASLLPIVAVLMLSWYHYSAEDYCGAENYQGKPLVVAQESEATSLHALEKSLVPVREREFNAYLRQGELPDGYQFAFTGGDASLVDGKIQLAAPTVLIEKILSPLFTGWRSALA